MSLLSRLDAAATRVLGAVAGVSAGGVREVAAVGVADVDTGLRLTPSTRLRVASLTKPVLATAAVRAWQARGIPLDGPVLGLLSALAPDWRADRALSLRHLLSHTSGLRPDVPLAEAESYGYSPDALARAVRQTVHMGQKYRPGATWQYGNAGFGLAGFALAALVGGSFEEALESELFTPARMNRTGFNDAEAVGHVKGRPVRATYWPARRAGGGLVSTVDDMLTFAEIAMADESSLRVTGVTRDEAFLDNTARAGVEYTLDLLTLAATYIHDEEIDTHDITHTGEVSADIPIGERWLLSPFVGYSSDDAEGGTAFAGMSVSVMW